MIVDSCGADDMIREMQADRREIEAAMKLAVRAKFMREYREGRLKMPCSRFIEHTCRSRNHYLVRMKFVKEDDLRSPMYAPICLFDSDMGKKAVEMTSSTSEIFCAIEYEPHVFKRYKERMGLDLDGIKLMKHFFQRNTTMFLADGKRKGGTEADIMIVMKEGCLFGEQVNEIGIVAKTFISKETLIGYRGMECEKYNSLIDSMKQKYWKEYYDEKRDEINEENK